MEYLVSFLEGIVTFVSPCLLPMLPLYLAYFAGNQPQETTGEGRRPMARTIVDALGFVLGFTVLFTILGALSGTLGGLIVTYRTWLDVIAGIIVIIFGLHFMGVARIPFLDRTLKPDIQVRVLGFPSSFLFGVVFAIGWTPCVGAFLGSALLLAASQGTVVEGVLMLLVYSLGLGIPFLICALLVGYLDGAFAALRRHQHTIGIVCGVFLVVIGVLMAFGLLGGWMTALGR